MKHKFTLEFDMKGTPPPLLWKYISTPQSMAQWFADEVTQQGNRLSFNWRGGGNDADIIASRMQVYNRFKWVDDEDSETFFEMRIISSELTQGTTLVITDWAEDEADKHSMTELWEHQVETLKRIIGCK